MKLDELRAVRMEKLAAEYRARGYEVFAHPDRRHLPNFMIGRTPDLVARSASDNVIIQVSTPRDFDPEQNQKLAALVESEPGWRLEVAFVSLPVAPDVPADEDLAAEEQITQLIENAELLSRQRQTAAAALLAWSAVEAILRRRAQADAPELERQSSARLLKHLYSLGTIQPQLYESLLRLMEFRNAVAHGFTPKHDAPDLPEVITDIRRLQAA